MNFQWLKRYVPRGLYSRAALILVLPVVTLQLVVSVVFIQRHFEGVTHQMTEATAREVRLFLDTEPLSQQVTSAQLDHLAQALNISVAPYEGQVSDFRRWYDLTGIVVVSSLRDFLPEVRAIQLPDDAKAMIYMQNGPVPVVVTVDRRRLSASNAHQLLVNMVFFGGLMTVIAYIYLRNQLRPITRLAAAAEAFGKGRTVPYRPAGALEVRSAGHAFLDMRARIERQIEQRTLLLSGVSHDLRTPLTRLKLGLAMLDSDERDPMERDVDDMQRMLDGFLSFSKGTTESAQELTDPIALVTQLVEDSRRANPNVRQTQVEGAGQMMISPMAIRRAVTNLIDNALNYGTHAQVSVRLTEKALRIRVEDDGPGIPQAQRTDAVKPFNRLDMARNQNKATGVGLGLAICNDIARAHGGVLRLSDSIDMGGLQADLVIGR